MTRDIQPMCVACEHLHRSADNRTCNAFPEGIPEEIWVNQHDHHKPYPGDQGVRFELAPIPEARREAVIS